MLLSATSEALKSQTEVFNTEGNSLTRKQYITEKKVFLHPAETGKSSAYFLIDARGEKPVTIAVIKPVFVDNKIIRGKGFSEFPGISHWALPQREELAYQLAGDLGVSTTTLIKLEAEPGNGKRICSLQAFIPDLELIGLGINLENRIQLLLEGKEEKLIDDKMTVVELPEGEKLSLDELQKMAMIQMMTGDLDINRSNFGLVRQEGKPYKIAVFDLALCLSKQFIPPRRLLWINWDVMREPLSETSLKTLQASSWESKKDKLLAGREDDHELIETAFAYHTLTQTCLLKGMSPYDVAACTMKDKWGIPSVLQYCVGVSRESEDFKTTFQEKMTFVVGCYKQAREYLSELPKDHPIFIHSTDSETGRLTAFFNDALSHALIETEALKTSNSETFMSSFEAMINKKLCIINTMQAISTSGRLLPDDLKAVQTSLTHRSLQKQCLALAEKSGESFETIYPQKMEFVVECYRRARAHTAELPADHLLFIPIKGVGGQTLMPLFNQAVTEALLTEGLIDSLNIEEFDKIVLSIIEKRSTGE
jgi:hypothetical protein